MKNRKEIKFRADRDGLMSRQNGLIFRIYEIPMADRTAPYIVSVCSAADPETRFTTSGYRYFSLDAAKEFCRQVSAVVEAAEKAREATELLLRYERGEGWPSGT